MERNKLFSDSNQNWVSIQNFQIPSIFSNFFYGIMIYWYNCVLIRSTALWKRLFFALLFMQCLIGVWKWFLKYAVNIKSFEMRYIAINLYRLRNLSITSSILSLVHTFFFECDNINFNTSQVFILEQSKNLAWYTLPITYWFS